MRIVDIEKLRAIVEPVVIGQGYELVDLEWKNDSGWVLRVFIDVARGVSHEDCANVSHQLSTTLDVADVIQQHYRLEVSSPGLDRPLRKESDFLRFVGKRAKLQTREPLADPKSPDKPGRRNFSGHLLAVADGKVRIDVGDREWEVPLSSVEKAHLIHELQPAAGGAGRRKN